MTDTDDPRVAAIITTLEPVMIGQLEPRQVELLIEKYPDMSLELAALDLVQWAEKKGRRIDLMGDYFDQWLARDKAKTEQRREAARGKQRKPEQRRDPRDAPPEQREAWMRSNVQDFVERTVFLQESFGRWERERHEATGEYADKLHPERRAKIRGEIIARRLIEGNRWTVGVPSDVEWETAEYEQKERKRLALPLLNEAEVRRRFRHLGPIGKADRKYTLLLPPEEGGSR
jgi:hypothetical protein